jgi:hypothetical protein
MEHVPSLEILSSKQILLRFLEQRRQEDYSGDLDPSDR